MTTYRTAANRYASFRDEVFASSGSQVAEPSPIDIPEMELQAMWFGGEFGRHFSGTRGETIEIVQFGHWNHSAGPDFTEVAVRIDGQLHSGSLEIDLSLHSWESHGHGANTHFDDVVLHVFLNHDHDGGDFYTRTSQHQEITQLRIDPAWLHHAKARDLAEAFPGRCLTPLQQLSDTAAETLIESAAQYRLERKSRRLSAMADATSADQMMYQAIAEALGYRKNKYAMSIMAQRNPIKSMLLLPSTAREAHWYGTAGWMQTEVHDASLSEETSTYLKDLWQHWWKIRPEIEAKDERRAIKWHLAGTRPVNHPQRRLGALAALVDSWNAASAIWKNPTADITKHWTVLLESLQHDHWQHHYTLHSKRAAKAMRLIGQDRQRDILGNVLFPYCLADHPELWAAFLSLPAVDGNEKLRRAQLRLFGTKKHPTIKRYYQQQALLQIYDDFCLEDTSECAECPFPEQLCQWQ